MLPSPSKGNVIELRDLIFRFIDKSPFLECSNRVTAIIRIITDDALHILYLNSMTLPSKGENRIKKEKNMDTEQKYPLRSIYFYLTEGCDLRCRHCWINPKYQAGENTFPTLDLKLFQHIITQAKALGLSGVKLTGGEPMLHPHIHKILEIVRSEDLRLTIETNGMRCTSEIADKIAGGKNPFVSVSLDGSTPDVHEWVRGVPGSFEKTLIGIENLVNAGLKPQIIMTVMRRNKDQVKSLIQLAESLGAGSVKFNIVQPTERGERMHRAGEILSIEELIELGEKAENTLSQSTKLRLVYHHPHAFKPLGNMLGSGNSCGTCHILNILGVLPDGSYAMCGIGESTPELIYGDASTDSLEDVWNNSPVINELREGIPNKFEGICGECLMKGICIGSCIAQNYYSSKSLWAPFWYCEEARKIGRFPGTRMKPARAS